MRRQIIEADDMNTYPIASVCLLAELRSMNKTMVIEELKKKPKSK